MNMIELEREKGEKELYKLNDLRKKLEAEEAEAKNEKLVLVTHKSLFPTWSHKRIQKEATKDPNLYWLEPTISFDLSIDVEFKLDFPITPRVFLFRCFEKIEKFVIYDSALNQKFFSFYLKYAKQQYEIWNLKRIMALNVGFSVQI
ncbi:unnamed protein product [Lactuca virosa]|uniref:Uncharacterized protein n=1 Tax=Lactuca virosa TaxID=75947 RepID=A0AAU9M554_9ASTR|nr:unnamed protein product [Lactuca virosa]